MAKRTTTKTARRTAKDETVVLGSLTFNGKEHLFHAVAIRTQIDGHCIRIRCNALIEIDHIGTRGLLTVVPFTPGIQSNDSFVVLTMTEQGRAGNQNHTTMEFVTLEDENNG